jgi:hypothetical protein
MDNIARRDIFKVFRICDILRRIRILESVHCITDLDLDEDPAPVASEMSA